jgi:hypothetical protein
MADSSGKEREMLDGYVYRSLDANGPLVKVAAIPKSHYPEAPFPEVGKDDINLVKGTVVAGKGTPGLSAIMEEHLSDYFTTRWEQWEESKSNEEKSKAQRNDERFAAAAQKVEEAQKQVEKATGKALQRALDAIQTNTKAMRDTERNRTTMRRIFAVVRVAHLRELGFAVFRNDQGYPFVRSDIVPPRPHHSKSI